MHISSAFAGSIASMAGSAMQSLADGMASGAALPANSGGNPAAVKLEIDTALLQQSHDMQKAEVGQLLNIQA